jgi:hypothetical protein
MRTYPSAQCLNRQAVVYFLSLVGGGLGADPTVEAPGAPSNIFESIERTGPGEYTLTLTEKIRAARLVGATYYNSDEASVRQRTIELKNRDVVGDKTLILLVKPNGGSQQVDEFTDAIASNTAGLKAATATTVAIQSYTAADLLAAGKDELLARPRNVTFTTAGGTPAHAPADVVVTGTDINGDALTETITLAQTATTAEGAKCFRTITSIVYAAGDGASATIAIGFGKKFGLSAKAKVRAGAVMRGTEISAGTVVTNGTLATPTTSPPNGSYSPNTNPDGSVDYAIAYETDGGVDLLTTEAFDLEIALFRGTDLS